MKNKNLLMMLAIAIIVLVACDNGKQIANSDELKMNNSSEVPEAVKSGEQIGLEQFVEDEYYEIMLSKTESYETLQDVEIHKYELTGMKNSSSQKLINDKLESLYNEVVNECEKQKEIETLPSLNCNITMNNEYVFSFCISKKLPINNETYVKEFYTINKNTGELLELSDFYLDSNYMTEISKKIYSEFESRKEQSSDGSNFYELDEKDFYEKIMINPQSFYVSENNELVYYFQKYEIGSGVIGEQEFVLIENIEF